MTTGTGGTAEGSPTRGLVGAAAAASGTTGVLHVAFAFTLFAGSPAGPLFLAMGLIYLAGIAAYFANFRRSLVLKAAPVWVVLLLVTWAAAAASGATPQPRDPLAFLDKAVEVALLVILLRLRKSAKSSGVAP